MALKLYYDEYASTNNAVEAKKLVLLHGWGMNSLAWDDVMPELLKHFRVTVIDLPGLGRSPVPGGIYDLDYLVDHVLAVAPDEAIWMGWSLGGLIATKAATKYPERVRAVINVASSPSFVAREQWDCAMATALLQKFINIFDEDYEGTLIRFLALQAKGSVSIREDIRKLKELVYFHGLPAKQALRGGLEILRDADLRHEVQTCSVPLAYILGEHDHLVPASAAQHIRKLLPGSEVAVVEGVSHIPFVQAPQLFMQAFSDVCDVILNAPRRKDRCEKPT